MIPRSIDDLQAAPPRAWSRIAEAHRRAHGPHARLHEREVRRLRRRAGSAGLGADGRNERGRTTTSSRFQRRLARDDLSLTHTIVQPDHRQSDRRADRRQPGAAAQGRRDRRRHRRARRAHPGHAGAVRRRDRGLSRRIRCRPGADGVRARPSPIPMDTPGLIFLCRDSAPRRARDPFDQPLSTRFDEQDAFVHLRRRRGAAATASSSTATSTIYNSVMRPHRRARQHHAADHHPRAHQAGVRLRPGDAHGRGGQRREPGDPRDAGRAARATSRSTAQRGAARPPSTGDDVGDGVWFPDGRPLQPMRSLLADVVPAGQRDHHR